MEDRVRQIFCDIAEGQRCNAGLANAGWTARHEPSTSGAADVAQVAVIDELTQTKLSGRPATIFLASPGSHCRTVEGADAILYRPAEPAVIAHLAGELVSGTPDRAPEARISALQARYLEGLTARVEAIDADLRWGQSHDDAHALDNARKSAHRIHGTAGMYGFPELGDVAGRVEAAILAMSASVLSPEQWDRLWVAVRDLRTKARSVTAGIDGSHPYLLIAGSPAPVTDAQLERFGHERALTVARSATLVDALRRVRRIPPDLIHISTNGDAQAWTRALRLVPGCASVPVVVSCEAIDDCLWSGAVCTPDGELAERLDELSPTGQVVGVIAKSEVAEQIRIALQSSGIVPRTYTPGQEADLYILGPDADSPPGIERARSLRLLHDFSPASRRAALTDAADYAAIPVIAEELVHRLADLSQRIESSGPRPTASSSGLPTGHRFVEKIARLRPAGGCVTVGAIRARELDSLNDRFGSGARDEALSMVAQVLRARLPLGTVRGQIDSGGLSVAFRAPSSRAALHAVRCIVNELSGMAFVLDTGVAQLSFRAGLAWTAAAPRAEALLTLAQDTQIQAACAPQRGALALAACLD